MGLMSILVMAAFALISVAAKNGWTLLMDRLSGQKDPDRQKLVRAKAWTALSALGGAVLILGWLFWKGMLMTADLLPREYALYIGLGLLIVGLQMAAKMPKRRKFGLALMAIGALLVAYGLGYLG